MRAKRISSLRRLALVALASIAFTIGLSGVGEFGWGTAWAEEGCSSCGDSGSDSHDGHSGKGGKKFRGGRDTRPTHSGSDEHTILRGKKGKPGESHDGGSHEKGGCDSSHEVCDGDR